MPANASFCSTSAQYFLQSPNGIDLEIFFDQSPERSALIYESERAFRFAFEWSAKLLLIRIIIHATLHYTGGASPHRGPRTLLKNRETR